ncbi:MAG: alkaline shock response membrane anchor protein AmaP [Clostridia bacterium]|nr:alkaline shock response membrane anchor protein AmaP [Clostridia bacterium]
MGWFDRALLTVYSFITGSLSVVFFLVVLGWEAPLRIWGTMAQSSQQQAVLAVIIALIFLASVKLLLSSLQKRVVSHTIIKDTPLGQIHITVEALENLVLKTGYQVTGVKELKPRIIMGDSGISVILKAIVSSDLNIPSVSDQLQLRIKDYLAEVAGIEVRGVKILVTNISGEGRARVE